MTTATSAFLTDPDLADLLANHGEGVAFPRHHVIFAQGNRGDQLYVIQAGRVKITMDGPLAQEILLALHGPADMFGDLSAFDPCPRTSTATAVTDVQAVAIRYAAFRERLSNRPQLAEYMLRSLARQVRRANTDRNDLVFTDVPSRTAKALLQLAARFGHAEGRALRVVHGLTQRELAQYIGASREVMNKVLSNFAQRGWLRVEGSSVLIFDPRSLARRVR